MSSSDVFNWNKLLLELLYGKIINIIKENDGLHIFNNGNSVFFLCNDKVYAFGECHDCIDCEGDAIVPIQVQNLENIGIEALCTGNTHAVLLDRNGSVFCWGNNKYGQIGCGELANVSVRVPYKVNLPKILQISCGGYYTLALSRQNEVWFWGDMMYCSKSPEWFPIKVNLPSNIKSISAGLYHTAVLSYAGTVFTWGSGSDFMDVSKNVSQPREINLSRKVQNVIASGNGSFLRISNTEWYFTRRTETDLGSLEPFNHTCGEVIAIAALYHTNKIAVINREGMVYKVENNSDSVVVTRFDDCVYNLFKETPSLQSNGHFLYRTGTGIMPHINDKHFYIITSDFFNNNYYSDITFKLTIDVIYAHKIILIHKSEYFKKLFEDDTEGTLKEIDVTNFNSQSYKAYIKYLYTASLDIEMEHLPELYFLAEQHCNEELKILCLKMGIEGMNRHNIVQLYHNAYLYKAGALMNACRPILNIHLRDIVTSQEMNELSDSAKYSLTVAGFLYNSN